jgi:hypothetical protein
MLWFRIIALCAVMSPGIAHVALADPRIQDEALNQDRLRDILLGRVTMWTDGTPIVLILVEEHDAAQQSISGRDMAQLLRGWKRLVYGGNGAMPVVQRSVEEALAEAKRRRGSLMVINTRPESTALRIVYEAKP